MNYNDEDLVSILRRIESLSRLSDPELEQITHDVMVQTVPRGSTLMHEGDQPDALYLVLRGRLTVLSCGRPIAELGIGEPVGEIGFFAGTHRSATVVAARDSTVLVLTRERYDALIQRSPQLCQGILSALATRLGRGVPDTPKIRPRPGNVNVVLDPTGTSLDPALVAGLRTDFVHRSDWKVLILSESAGLAERLALIEQNGLNALLIVMESADSVLAIEAMSHSDAVVMVRRAKSDPAITPLERRIQAETLPSNLHLVRWFDAGQPFSAGQDFLAGRNLELHHNLRDGEPAGITRLGRFIRGEALGIVMSGGGSFGCAHFGAFKALQEAGLTFDMLGGTSIGAAITGALATGITPEEGITMLEDMFLRQRAMSKYALPRYAMLDHRLFDAELQKHLGTCYIEDLPRQFFAVATSLTETRRITIRNGPLWQAVRASTSLPGIFQPFVTKEGHVWIDGGLMDNTPISVMRGLKPGRNLVLSFPANGPLRSERPYATLPGRFEVIRSLFSAPPTDAPPSMFAVLSEAMVITSRRQLAEIEPESDTFVEVPLPSGMSFLDWSRGREAFNGAYAAIRDHLEQSQADPLDALSWPTQ